MQWRIVYYHRMWGQLSTTCSNLLKDPDGELLVAVDHNQVRTMASEKVDSIDWSHPPPSWAVPPDRLVHSKNRCSSATAGIRSCNLATFSMRGIHLAYETTQSGLSIGDIRHAHVLWKVVSIKFTLWYFMHVQIEYPSYLWNMEKYNILQLNFLGWYQNSINKNWN